MNMDEMYSDDDLVERIRLGDEKAAVLSENNININPLTQPHMEQPPRPVYDLR